MGYAMEKLQDTREQLARDIERRKTIIERLNHDLAETLNEYNDLREKFESIQQAIEALTGV